MIGVARWQGAALVASLLCAFPAGARYPNGDRHQIPQELRRLALEQPAEKTALDIQGLQDLFESPPADARIMMRWWWFGPAVEPSELDRELQVMASAGIGGVEVQPVYPLALDDEAEGIRTRPFLSDQFLAALRSAASTAARLGMRLDLTLGSGWPYGGPTVPIAEAASRLRHEARRIAAADAAIVVPPPALSEGERLLAAFFVADQGERTPLRLATSTDQSGGIVVPPRAAGRLLLFIASRTGMQVKRAAVGAEGFVLDHYDPSAVEHYLHAVGDRLLSAFAGQAPPYAIFCDSLEVYEADWTRDLPQEFRRRRGYDLLPYLPALIGMDVRGGSPDVTASARQPRREVAAEDVRYDWGRTLTELLNERFVVPLQAWARGHATRLRMQAYGIPPAALSTSAHVDLPEGEGADWRRLTAVRWASSASHAYGVPVTSAETWTWLHSPAFRATPLDMKVEADRHFLQGATQIIGHGWPYSPPSAAEPGWRFYAAGVFSDHNPWWIVMPDVARYLQRVSAVLRQGAPVADVLIYLPVSDAWARFEPGRVNLFEGVRDRIGAQLIGTVLDCGFTPELVDDEMLQTLGRIEGSRLRVGALDATTIILPGVRRMPPETMALLERFAAAGGHVIATRRLPEGAPGLMASGADSVRVADAARRLFGPQGRGRFATDDRSSLMTALRGLDAPDLTLAPADPDIGFIHRRTPDADMYFVANTSNRLVTVEARARTPYHAAEWWNPVSGAIVPLDSRSTAGAVSATLSLHPYESCLLVFTDRQPPAEAAAEVTRQTIDVSGGWTVRFGDGEPRRMDRLRSWTDDPETRHFSGTATYERRVLVPDALVGPNRTVVLDFGNAAAVPPSEGRGVAAALNAPVREAAVVFVNGQRAGSVWSPPYAVDVTAALHGGDNVLRVVVGNLAINHMAWEPPPSYRLLNLRYGVRFEPQDMDGLSPLPSGLLGPVRLIGRSRVARNR